RAGGRLRHYGAPRSRQSRSPPFSVRSRLPHSSRRRSRSRRPNPAVPRSPSAGPRPSGTIESMTVPGRVEAASLLLSLDPPAWFVRHARAVAEVAAWLAARIDARGTIVDRRLIEAAALLHDVDKVLPATDPAHDLP